MYSQYVVLLFCLVLTLPTIQGKVMEFKVIDEAKGSSATNYMLGSSQITKRVALVTMQGAYDLIRKKIYIHEVPFKEKQIKEITLRIMKRTMGTEFDASNNEILASADYFIKSDSLKTFKTDFKRKIHFAMTFVFLKADDSKIPDNLQKGIANFIVFEAELAPDNWAKPGEGESWSQSSDITAQFLSYCNTNVRGFVERLVENLKLNEHRSSLEDYLSPWWKKYKIYYGV